MPQQNAGQPTINITPEFQPVESQTSQDSYQQLNNVISSFGQLGAEIVQKPLLQHASDKGKIEGAQEDYEPSKFNFTGLGRAEQEAAIQSHTSLISTDINNKTNELYAKWSTPTSSANPNGGISKDSLVNFNKDYDTWSTAYLNNMNPIFRPDAQNKVSTMGSSANTKLIGVVGRITQNEETANILSNVKQSREDLQNQAYTGNVAGAVQTYDTINNNMKMLLATDAIKGPQYADTMFPIAKDVRNYTWLGQAHTAIPQGNIDGFYDNVDKSNLPELTKEMLKVKGTALNNNFLTQTSAEHFQAQTNLRNNLVDQVKNGAQSDPQIANQLRTINPAAAILYIQLSGMMQDSSFINNQVKWTSIQTSRQTLGAIKLDPNDPDLYHKQQVLLSVQNANENRIQQLINNPADFTENAPSVIQARQAATLTPNYNNLPVKQQQQLQQQYGSAAQISLQRALGLSQSQLGILNKNDRQQLASSLTDLSSPQAIQQAQSTIDNIVNAYGSNANIALSDMHKLKVPENLLDIANLDKIPASAIQLPTIYQAIATPYAQLKGAVEQNLDKESDYYTAAQKQLKPLLQTLSQNGSSSIARSQNMVNLVVRSAMADVIKTGDTYTVAVKKMSDAIYNNRYSGISGYVRVPANVSFDQAKKALMGLKTQIDGEKVQFNDLGRLPGNTAQPSDIRKDDMITIKNGYWKSYPDDSGVYWVDANGQPVTLKGTNNNYDLTWPNMEIPGSTENNKFHEAIKKAPSLFSKLFSSEGSR